MDGYSVQEAASVLGVAEGRVWELLARGVLLGTPEGDSMRVFLKAQPGPIATAGTSDEPPRTNGNGGSHGAAGEASAFRELLTEFRNLTERYGQALLALGEARGEVAGLRSRVDQLEARLDLRLPPPLEAAPVAWESATIPAAAAEPASPVTPRPLRQKPRARKPRSPREAVAGFADALARAQDPNAAELGESRGAPEALAEPPVPDVPAPDEFITAEAETPVAVAPAEAEPEAAAVAEETLAQAVQDEAPVAEQEEVLEAVAAADVAADDAAAGAVEESAPDAEQPTYSAVVVEPDWFADGDFAWLDAAEMEASAPVEAPAAAVETAELEQEAVAAPQEVVPEPFAEPVAPVDALPEPEVEPEPEPAVAIEEVPAPQVSEPEPASEPSAVPVFEAAAEEEVSFEAWQPPGPTSAEAELAVEPPTMSSAVAVEEEEVMWLGPEPSPPLPDERPAEQRAQVDEWPAVDSPAASTEAVRPPLAMTEDELARLALDEGWDEAEVAAIRAMITPVSSARVDLPGAAELHEAMAALEAVPVQGDPAYDVSRQWAKPASVDEQPPRHDDWAFEAEPAPPVMPITRPPSDVTAALRRSVADPGWLRRRQGPAAAAYRRLRRLFPG